MSVLYITPTDFLKATTGAFTKDLPADGLTQYVGDACAWIDLYCERTFVQQLGLVETLLTSGVGGGAVIDRAGVLHVYPGRGYPVQAVTSLTWRARGAGLGTGTSLGAATTVAAGDTLIDQDRWGEGWRVLGFVDLGAYRDPGTTLQATLTYDAGYPAASYPDWLKRAAVLATMGMLRRRDGPQMVVTDTTVRDLSASLSEFKQAATLLESRRRKF